MTVTPSQVTAAKAQGMVNVEAIAAACNVSGAKFYLACAMIYKESGGRNIWGNDAGGVFRGLTGDVTQELYRAFKHELFNNGRTSNGCGPAQITYKGFFDDMDSKGLRPWVPADNILYGVRLLWSYYLDGREQGKSNADAIVYSGKRYNGADAYGADLLIQARRWLKIVGSDDYN